MFETISLKNVWRDNWADPGERQRPDGDDIIVTQVRNDKSFNTGIYAWRK